ncbi:MAG: cation-translocating P-type ATPase [Candidatus Sumerlaeota bacterium]|nr:cation-translocating P-type ATPase [Candidatus Sumerlaeota bacterium]
MEKAFKIGEITGLTSEGVSERLERDGYNELPASKKRSIFAIALDVVREPMFLLLVACGVIYLMSGGIEEALMLLFFVFVVMGITLYQERKTERALEALRDLTSPRALVIRNGEEQRIAGRDVVRDDILVLNEGDRVPADAVLLSCGNLKVDESMLTGESVPVRKMVEEDETDMGHPGGEDLPFVYSGTLVVQGRGIARVLATGIHTEMGKIGKVLQSLGTEETRLQKETNRMVRKLAMLGLSLCVLVVIIYGLTRADWKQGLLAGITLAMATLPEEFPVVLTIFLALGAWRMSRERILTRRMPAIEALGSATVLCVDKTGTLTLNSMTVSRIFAKGHFFDVSGHGKRPLPEIFHEMVEFSILGSQRDPFDPMEKAIKQFGERFLARTEHIHHDWTLVHEYPLSRELLALSHVWRSPDGVDYVIAAKGAPEAIADLCHFDEKQWEELNQNITIMADEGLRVLGVAKARFQEPALPDGQHDFTFIFLGLVGLTDPVRPTVSDAIKECHSAGIGVMMITGDYPGTAQNIARQIGMTPWEKTITGPEMQLMTDEELRERIRKVNIFARVVPEQKLRIVNALKANGEIVAMTGDGVNDAPALKAAHIGIAMGGRGADVARESASLVLLEDDFSSIVRAVRMGRRIFDNIKKAITYIFAIHVPIAGMSLIPVIFRLPLVLLPVHIVFLELIIDPACSVVFEAEPAEDKLMERPPRKSTERLFSKNVMAIGALQGLSVLIMVLLVYVISLYRAQSEMEARALTFTTLIIANLCLILTNRSWSRTILKMLRAPNDALWWVVGGAAVFLALVLYVPFLRNLFRFSYMHAVDIFICLGAGVMSIIWFEGLKVFRGPKKMNIFLP